MRPSSLMVAADAVIGFAPARAWAQQVQEPNRYGYSPYMMMDWSGWGDGMIFGPLFMILVLVVAIAVAVVLVRGLGGPWQGTQPPQSMQPARTPLDILKERYARGEIDKDEFEERRRVLGY
jgi:putative membrane protein